jgi:polyisoprenoid-binding protein YceI
VGSFAVDPGRSRLTITARSRIHPIHLDAPVAGDIAAEVAPDGFDIAQPITASLIVELDQLRSDDRLVSAELKRRLDTAHHPLATFTVDSVSYDGGDAYRLTARLALLGITKPFVARCAVTLDGLRMSASGSVSLDVRDFGITPPRMLMVRVEPDIAVDVSLVAELQPADEGTQ